MTDPPAPAPAPVLSIDARCRDDADCRFRGEDVFLDIRIVNTTATEEIGFPLAYLQKTGPIIRLVDVKTEAETYLKRNLADHALRAQLTTIAPGESLSLRWVLMADELRQLGSPVDVNAEITVMAEVLVGGRRVPFRGGDTLRIREVP
jgi:hypothetical protein